MCGGNVSDYICIQFKRKHLNLHLSYLFRFYHGADESMNE